MAVVEPDGKVTAVGTWGEPEESAIVSAINGQLWGMVSFSLLAEGPGPTLDFVVEAPSAQGMSTATCCSTPARLIEGEQVKFRLLRRNAEHTDVTRRSSGTRYILFSAVVYPTIRMRPRSSATGKASTQRPFGLTMSTA